LHNQVAPTLLQASPDADNRQLWGDGKVNDGDDGCLAGASNCVPAYALAKATDEPLLFKGEDFGFTDIRSHR
jgi:hypothetical protein